MDTNMDSPYYKNNYKKRIVQRKTNTNITPTQDLNKNEKSRSSTNKKTKSIVQKVGNPNDVHMSWREPIEQAF